MSIDTALALLLPSAGELVAHRDRAPMAIVRSPGPEGRLNAFTAEALGG